MLICFVSCQSTNDTEAAYSKLKSKKYIAAIYERIELKDNVAIQDTMYVHVEKDEFINRHYSAPQNGRDLEMYFLTNYSKSNPYDCTLTYEVALDSIVYIDTVIRKIAVTKMYEVNNKEFEINKQADCLFCKGKPNVYAYYTDELGLLFSESKFRTIRLVSFDDHKKDMLIEDLVKNLRNDTDFCNLKF